MSRSTPDRTICHPTDRHDASCGSQFNVVDEFDEI